MVLLGRREQKLRPGMTGTKPSIKRQAEDSLRLYVKLAWKVLEPAEELKWNWHLDLICDRLEAMTRGELKNLLVNVPPGMMKSLLVSVFWPTWEWGPQNQPSRRYIFSAYGGGLSLRDNDRARRLINSEWYQAKWGDRVQIDPVINAKSRYQNLATGLRYATSVGAGATGERAGTVVFDDPHKLEDAYYPEALNAAIRHKNEVLSSRGVGDDSRKVIIMQRVAEGDVTEDTLKKMASGGDQYEVIAIPMHYDPDWSLEVSENLTIYPPPEDPRTEPGELLAPQMQSEEYVHNLEVSLEQRAPAILDQRPLRKGFKMFRRSDMRYFYESYQSHSKEYLLDDPLGPRAYLASDCYTMLTVDLAASTEEGADFTCIEAWAVTPDNDMLLVDVAHERVEGPDQMPLLWGMNSKHRPAFVGIESTQYQLTFVQEAVRAGLPARELRADKNKSIRAIPYAARHRAGKVFFLATASWLKLVEDELLDFPGKGHDDTIDPGAYAARELAIGRGGVTTQYTPKVQDSRPFGKASPLFNGGRQF